jgi:hypothetical protein
MSVTLPQYLVLTSGLIPRVGLHWKSRASLARAEATLQGKKFTEENTSMATKKKAAKKKKKH